MLTIAFTGGGTGGHIYPGLAVIEYIKEKFPHEECRIIWIGLGKGRDRSVIEDAGIEFFGIPAGKLRRYFTLQTIPDIFRVMGGFFAARKILKKQKVSLLFSKGGFVSVPPCAAASSLGIPVCTHESDFSPGLATRLNLRFVRKSGGKVFVAYNDTMQFMPADLKDKIIVSGNPVRRIFRNADPAKGRAFLKLNNEKPVLLVLGGSQGAKEINDLISGSLENLCLNYTVVHQYGPEQDWDLPRTESYIPLPYISGEMPHVLAAAGKPMVLIPLSGSGTRGDQVENARFFEKEGAALVLTGRDAKPEKLSALINSVTENPELREKMAEAARRIGSLDGAAIAGDSILDFLKAE